MYVYIYICVRELVYVIVCVSVCKCVLLCVQLYIVLHCIWSSKGDLFNYSVDLSLFVQLMGTLIWFSGMLLDYCPAIQNLQQLANLCPTMFGMPFNWLRDDFNCDRGFCMFLQSDIQHTYYGMCCFILILPNRMFFPAFTPKDLVEEMWETGAIFYNVNIHIYTYALQMVSFYPANCRQHCWPRQVQLRQRVPGWQQYATVFCWRMALFGLTVWRM